VLVDEKLSKKIGISMASAGVIRSLWDFRGFVVSSVKREYQLSYRGSILGVVWTVLQPLAMILIYTIIFSQVMRAKLPGVDNTFAYSIYLCSGIITWGLFIDIMQRSQSVFIDNANLLKKINFPRLILPVIVVASALLRFSIIFTIFLVFLLITGNLPGSSLLAILPLLAVQVLFAVGLGGILGVLNVFFRDVGQFTGLLLQLWFWGTPIVYPASILPEWILPWISFNPMYHLMQGYRTIFVSDQWPEWQSMALVAILSVGLCVYALSLFRRHADEIVDEL